MTQGCHINWGAQYLKSFRPCNNYRPTWTDYLPRIHFLWSFTSLPWISRQRWTASLPRGLGHLLLGGSKVPELHRAGKAPLDVREVEPDEVFALRLVSVNDEDERRHLLREPEPISPRSLLGIRLLAHLLRTRSNGVNVTCTAGVGSILDTVSKGTARSRILSPIHFQAFLLSEQVPEVSKYTGDTALICICVVS